MVLRRAKRQSRAQGWGGSGQEELVYIVGRDDAVCGCGVCAGKGGGAFGIGLMNRLERSTIQKSYKKFGMESKNHIRNLNMHIIK